MPRFARPVPATVLLAVVGIGIHAFDHVRTAMEDLWGLLADPAHAHFNPGNIYHPLSAPLYAWLAVMIWRGRGWARVLMTISLAGQFAGRFVVFFAFPQPQARADLLGGWLVSTAVLILLWAAPPTREYFRRRKGAPEAVSLPDNDGTPATP